MQFMKHEESTEEKARREQRMTTAFNDWMAEPMTRYAMSTIPAGEHQDALKMLLRAAFESGFSAGQCETAIMMVEGLMKARKNDRD